MAMEETGKLAPSKSRLFGVDDVCAEAEVADLAERFSEVEAVPVAQFFQGPLDAYGAGSGQTSLSPLTYAIPRSALGELTTMTLIDPPWYMPDGATWSCASTLGSGLATLIPDRSTRARALMPSSEYTHELGRCILIWICGLCMVFLKA